MSTAALLVALERITQVEPRSETSRLDVPEWASALDEAQRIARRALDEWHAE